MVSMRSWSRDHLSSLSCCYVGYTVQFCISNSGRNVWSFNMVSRVLRFFKVNPSMPGHKPHILYPS